MELIKVYGLPNCDVTKAALKELRQTHKLVELIDIKQNVLTAKLLKDWFVTKGWEKLLNKRSTTWKNLDEDSKAKITNEDSAIEIILSHPTLLKRPVILYDGVIK